MWINQQKTVECPNLLQPAQETLDNLRYLHLSTGKEVA